jgi:hypothetical protein
MAVAFFFDKDLASLLEQDSPHVTELIPDFLTWLKLLIFHAHLLRLVSLPTS